MAVIDPSDGLAAAARAQLAAMRARDAGRSGGRPSATTSGHSTGGVAPALQRRIAAIPPEDPDRPRKAVRIYLESELAREFGAGLLNDPGFPALLDAVQQRMQDDEQTACAVEALGRLQTGARRCGPRHARAWPPAARARRRPGRRWGRSRPCLQCRPRE